MSESFRALALQVRTRSVNGCADRVSARELMHDSIERLRIQIAASVRFIGDDCKLVVLPEYVLSGHPVGEPISVWKDKAVIDPDGSEMKALASISQDLGIYLCLNAYESDDLFQNLYFQSSLILDPSGETILRYRRLNSAMTPTPHDVWEEYLGAYGMDAVFPVARTPLGNLACIASEEILFPEVARCLAARGAEVFLHSSSEVASTQTTRKQIAKRARAIENVAYVISANSGGIENSPIPGASTDAGSQIVDYEGRVLVEACPGETMAAFAEIDLDALRRARSRPGMDNLASRNRFELYAQTYATTHIHTADTLKGVSQPTREHFIAAQRDAIARLHELDS